MMTKKPRPEEEPEPMIVVLTDGGQDSNLLKFRFPLGPGVDVVGRDEACSVQLSDRQVSRKHVEIHYDHGAGGFMATDLGSANGTKVNGNKLGRSVPLMEGDIIDVGESRLLFTRQRFEEHVDALLYVKRHGERERGTLRMGES